MDTNLVHELFDLTDRTIIITGGSRGIGLALAQACAAQGAQVVVASRKLEACEQAASQIRGNGGVALGVGVHMGEMESIHHLMATTVAEFGGLDLLVNNAANPLALPISEITEAAWDKSQEVNVKGPVFLAQAALPYLKQSDHAAVLNILSVAAITYSPGVSMYSAAKAAMLAWTRNMAAEWAHDGIRVNALAPGPVDTYMMQQNPPEAIERMKSMNLQGRIARVDELVGPALLLLSDAGSYITGQMLVVDGGFSEAR